MTTMLATFRQYWSARFFFGNSPRSSNNSSNSRRTSVNQRRMRSERMMQGVAARSDGAADHSASCSQAHQANGCNLTEHGLQLHSYQTLADAQAILQNLSSPANSTVVLVLAHNFAGDLPALIARDQEAMQLVLVPLGDTGGASLGDLALHSARFGWHTICREFVVNAAIQSAIGNASADQQVVIVWPSTQELKYLPAFARAALQ